MSWLEIIVSDIMELRSTYCCQSCGSPILFQEFITGDLLSVACLTCGVVAIEMY